MKDIYMMREKLPCIGNFGEKM
jgi:hypothetical protein